MNFHYKHFPMQCMFIETKGGIIYVCIQHYTPLCVCNNLRIKAGDLCRIKKLILQLFIRH